MKKLSRNEVLVVSNEVINSIKKVRREKLDVVLKKDKNYLEILKLYKEKEKLSDKIDSLSNKIMFVNNELRNKYKIYVNRFKNSENKWEMSINEIGNMNEFININNEIVLMSIDKELNVENLIKKLVEKYSK